MFNLILLQDLKLHRQDLKELDIPESAIGRMIDRVVRDIVPDSAMASHTKHGVRHTNYESYQCFLDSLRKLEGE